MPCSSSCEDTFLRLHWTDIKHLIKTKLANLGIRSYFSQKVFFLPYRKKINTRRHFSSQYIFVVILPLLISQKLQFSIIFQIYRSLSKTKHPAACMRYFLFIWIIQLHWCIRVIGIVKVVWCNILYHFLRFLSFWSFSYCKTFWFFVQ